MRAALACAVLATAFLSSEAPSAAAPHPDTTMSAAPQRGTRWPIWLTRDNVLLVLRDCDDRAAKFRKSFDRALDRSRLDGMPAEEALNRRARRLEDALSRTRRAAEHDDYAETRRGVREAVVVGKDINKAMRSLRLRGQTEEAWVLLRGEINALARRLRLPIIG